MFSNFFKPKKNSSINLSQLFDLHCSLPFYKKRSPETQDLAEIIKQNAVLNYDGNKNNLAKLPLISLRNDLDKIFNVYNAVDTWYKKRKDVSERADKILEFRNKILRPYLRAIFENYQEKGGHFEKRWNADATSTSASESDSPRLGYSYKKCFGFIIGLPFVSQIIDAMPDLLGLFN
jgi:hypothetical protein